MSEQWPDGPYLVTHSSGEQSVLMLPVGDLMLHVILANGATLTPLVPKTEPTMNEMLLRMNHRPQFCDLYYNDGRGWRCNYGLSQPPYPWTATNYYYEPLAAVRAAWEAVTGGDHATE